MRPSDASPVMAPEAPDAAPRAVAGPVLAAALLLGLAALGALIAPRGELERGDASARAPSGVLPAAVAVQAGGAEAGGPALPSALPGRPVAVTSVASASAGSAASAASAGPSPVPGPEACALLVARMPTVSRAQCEEAGLQPSGATSVKGLPLYWRDVPAPVARKGQGAEPLRVLVVGAIHGDELTAAALAMRWIALAQEAGRPVHWRFIPVLNPDGLLAKPATRVNASGVDLNRNFPTPGWAQDAPRYWEKRTRRDPRRWPGQQPLSEPESRFLHAQMAQFQPQLIVSIHAPYGVLDFDGPQPPPERLGRLWLDQVGIFPGSLGHYGGVHRGMPVVTIELPHALRMPEDAEVLSMWRDLLRWMAEHWPQVEPG